MKRDTEDKEMLEEYDFSHGVRGMYAKRYHEGSNVVVLDSDVAGHFPNAEAVNQALRTAIAIQQRQSA